MLNKVDLPLADHPVRLLLIEDNEDDRELIRRELVRGKLPAEIHHVETWADAKEALAQDSWDIIISDFSLNAFNALKCLELYHAHQLDIPFILISGTIGEEVAVEIMKAGAHDYIMKDRLHRLVPAIQRELKEAETRRAHRAAERSIYELTHCDPVTHLSNRSAFLEYLAEQVTSGYERTDVVIVIEIPALLDMRRVFGQTAMDQAVSAVATTLRSLPRATEFLARVSDSSFGLVAASLKGSDPDVPTRVRSILHLFDKPFHIEWTRIRLDAHAGSVTEAHGINNPLQTLQQAELAARQAVRGGLPWAVYSDQHQQVESERLELLGDLDHAIESGEVKPYYQPYLDLRPREPLLKGVESLARWIHPERGVLTPATFIAIAEESELIQGLTRCMVQETVHQLRTWADAGWRPEVSINLSTRNLPRKDLPDLLSRCVLEGGLKPEDFTLEITENLFIHHYEDSRDCLIRLHEMGFRLAIDDFGTGFSSLTYLKRLPVDRIKIDQSFVRDLLEDATDREIVQTIIGLAHRLHTEVLAEGVERNDQFELLRSLGCELVQGYFLTPPLPADQLRAWISQSGWATDSGTGGRPL